MILKQLNIDRIKEIELDMLLSFDEFCKNNNLTYYLAGGTLLGAVRHRGFIPWDDDIDVCMPRKDYDKLLDLYSDKESLSILSSALGNFEAPYTKIVKTTTRIEVMYSESKNNRHLWIDILPVDGLPVSENEVKDIYSKCDFYRTVLNLVDARLGEGKTAFKKYAKYLLRPLAKLYGKQRCIDNIEKIAAKYPYDESKYVGIVTWGLYGAGERMLKSEFEKPIEVEFEGHKFPAFSCWDSYLKGLYGDYMQLPPVEKRKTHDMVAYLIEED